MSVGSEPSRRRAPGPGSGPAGRRPSLEEILGAMERHEAGPGFTPRVLARSRERGPRRGMRWLWTLRVPLAVSAALAAAALAGFLVAPRFGTGARATPDAAGVARSERANGQAEALRVQLQALERELHELERLAAERQPLIAVEGDHADYVIDLRDFLPTTRPPGAVPASFDGRDPRGRRNP